MRQLADKTGIADDTIRTLLRADSPSVSLSYPRDDRGEVEYGEFLQQEDNSPDERFDRSIMLGRLHRTLDSLDEREREIIALRFGLVDGQAYSLGEIGRRYSLTRERIRQLEKRAMMKLRSSRLSGRLAAFLD